MSDMYEAFFDMKRTPFTSNIPSDKLYVFDQFDEALARLRWVAENQLFATVTADVGCGKTCALRRFRDDLDPTRFLCLYISDSNLTPRWLYNGLLEQVGAEPCFYRGDARRLLHSELEIIRGVQGKKVVTIIDESHLLNRETLDELRFLLNYHMDSFSPMALILAGQNELWTKLHHRVYDAVRQRIDIKCEIPQLDRSQCCKYIATHLEYAGGRTDIFTDAAIDEIYRFSAGASRAINKVCFHSLLCAAQMAKKLIDDRLVLKVVKNEFSKPETPIKDAKD